MCRSLAAGGRRCASSHPAVRAARRAANATLGHAVAVAGADHPAAHAYAAAQAWADKAHDAAENGDDALAVQCADQAKAHANASRALLTDPRARTRAPRPDDRASAADDYVLAPPEPPAPLFTPPEHVRSADALAGAAGVGAGATFLPRGDGSQTVAWSTDGFSGSATVHPGEDDDHPTARVVFTNLTQDRYEALAASPWSYRTENGHVVYDRVPVDQAEQIITAARTGQSGRPWEQHGLARGGPRNKLPDYEAQHLVPESSEWNERLDDRQREWVQEYTQNAFQLVNERLHKGHRLDDEAWKGSSVRQIATHLDAAIAKADHPRQPHRMYRGFTPPMDVRRTNRVAEWVRENFQVGQDYTDHSYASVSHCPDVAAEFARTYWNDGGGKSGHASHQVVFEVVSRHGAAVASLSAYKNKERERLMPRGSRFRVVGIHDDATVRGEKTILVQLVDVRDIPHH